MLKDILLFPYVWKSYSLEGRDKLKMILYAKGVAIDEINPKGYVRINGELWQAELVDFTEPIYKDDPIEVVEYRGLKLKIKKISSENFIDSKI